MPTIVATAGSRNANSYETHAEANAFFDERIPVTPPWVTSGGEAYLITACRMLDRLGTPGKTLIPERGGVPAYYRVRRQWTGEPATATQRLAWPRVGMFDANGNPLDVGVASVSQDASAATVTTDAPHRLATGEKAFLFGTGSTPAVDGEWAVTVVDETSFTIPTATTAAGEGGRMTVMPRELKDAQSELAGYLLKGDRTLENDVIAQGITSLRAGSVSLTFVDDLVQQPIPNAAYDLMPVGWLTEELFEPAQPASFEIASNASRRSLNGGGGRWL